MASGLKRYAGFVLAAAFLGAVAARYDVRVPEEAHDDARPEPDGVTVETKEYPYSSQAFGPVVITRDLVVYADAKTGKPHRLAGPFKEEKPVRISNGGAEMNLYCDAPPKSMDDLDDKSFMGRVKYDIEITGRMMTFHPAEGWSSESNVILMSDFACSVWPVSADKKQDDSAPARKEPKASNWPEFG